MKANTPMPTGSAPVPSTNATPVQAQSELTKAPLSARDLITVGVFTAIYFVVVFGSGMLGMINPFMSALGFLVGIFINGTVIMLFMVKVRAMGAMTVLGILTGLLMLSTGHFWGTLLLSALFGFLADLIVRSGNYRSRTRNILAFGVFQLWILGPLLPMFYDTTGYRAYIEQSMGGSYADAWMTLFTPANLIIFEILVFIVALGSAWLGTRVLDRNLARAGML